MSKDRWKIRKPAAVGAPLREKDWLALSEVLAAAKKDIAYNHTEDGGVTCEQADVDISVLDSSFVIARQYWARK